MRPILALLLLLGLFGAAAPARADDISTAGRGVVRVVTIASTDGEIVGFGHGSGFAIAPNRIVTNAHVVELAARYPDNVVIGVVPSEGDKSFRGRLIAYDPKRDLALIEFSGAALPPLTLYPGPVTDGEQVIALGYPGNVDLATAQSAADFIKPLSPVRSQGGYAGRRRLSGVEVLLHTAGIARGNSGGPLLDRCGRVIGVNSAITRAEDGDSTFGFAIADTEFASFLREAGQGYASTGADCVSVEDRLKQDEEAAAQRAEQLAAADAKAASAAAARRDAALEALRERQLWLRENFIGAATLLLVLGACLGGWGSILGALERRHARAWLVAGTAAMAAGVLVFFLRPTGTVSLPATAAAAQSGAARAMTGKLLCRPVPARSRINLSTPKEVALDWRSDGCADGRGQFVENGRKWERLLVPQGEQTVSLLEYRPDVGIYTENRFYLGANAMVRARKLRAAVKLKTCTRDPRALTDFAQAQDAIRAILPTRPDEWVSYDCAPAG